MAFTPVSLKPLDDAQKKSLLAGADSPTKIYAITFGLTGGPVQDWVNAFQIAWYQANNNNFARVVGKTLQLQSTIDGIPGAVARIKTAFVAANKKFEEQQKLKADNEAVQKKQKEDAKATAQAALSSALEKIDYS